MIRNAEIQDVSRIAEIIVFSKRMAYRPIFHDDHYLFSVLNVKGVSQDFAKEFSHILVYDDGIIKGMLRYQEMTGKFWMLEELYVDYFFQNSGIGKQLLKQLNQTAVGHGVSKIGLWVIENNNQAVSFYLKNDFVRTDRRQLIEHTEQWEFYMEMSL